MKNKKYLSMIRESTGTVLTVECPLEFEGRLTENMIQWVQSWIQFHHPEFFILEINDQCPDLIEI